MDDGRGSSSSGFGLLLRRHRLAAGLSQEALAERARMSTHGISALERGYRRTPQRETMALLASALALNEEERQAFERAAVRTGGIRRRGISSELAPPLSDESSLPLSLTSFVGRESELREIGTLLAAHRLVTLTGAGGIGKTQTALQAARALLETGENNVCFVPLAPVGDPSFLVEAVNSALGVQALPDRSALQTLLAHLKNKKVLLILDNCEHVIGEAAALTASLLANCVRVRVLVTSREPLKIPGEHTYRLPSLALASAIDLFADRANAADHHFALTDENMPIVRELCRRLDGIPLAIELAAARVNLFSVKTINERLADCFAVLTGGERTALARQQTMRAAIDWSYDLLPDSERRLFERLSIFAGCTFADAAALYAPEEAGEAEILHALSSLVDKSLTVADFERDEPRYRLLEAFRQYAREKLTDRGEEDVMVRRHIANLLGRAERSPKEWDRDGEIEFDNLRAALQWALIERRDILMGQRLAAVMNPGEWRASSLEVRRWLSLALDLAAEGTPKDLVAQLHQAEASVAFALREYKTTVVNCERAAALYREAGDRIALARALDMGAYALVHLGRVAEAEALVGEALQIARELGHRRLIAWGSRCLAFATAKRGDFAAARRYVAEVLPIYESEFSKADLAYAIYDLAMYEFGLGDTETAFNRTNTMLEIGREARYARAVITALNGLSAYLILLGRYAEAEQRAREAFALAGEQHIDVSAVWSLQDMAAVRALREEEPQHGDEARVRAAHVFGYAAARLEAMGSAQPIPQQAVRDRALAALRDALGQPQLAQLLERGAAMTEDEALTEALGD